MKENEAIISMEESSIYDLMCAQTVNNLKDVARQLSINGFSKLRKDKLIQVIVDHILDLDVMRKSFLYATCEELEAFSKIYEKPTELEKDEFYKYIYLMQCGYIYLNKSKFMGVPKEVKPVYMQINTEEFRKTQGRINLLNNYITAAINLYGIIPEEKLVEIFNMQNEEKTSIDEILDMYHGYERLDRMYIHHNHSFVEEDLLEENFYEKLLERQGDKPYYIPENKEFLKYADDLYFEYTAEYINLKEYILSEMKVEEEIAASVCEGILSTISLGSTLQEVIGELSRANIVCKDTKEINDILTLIMKLYNNTRIQANRGYTVDEMSKLQGMPQFKIPEKPATIEKSKKIGRNEKCTCGSGKKYKRCCGSINN